MFYESATKLMTIYRRLSDSPMARTRCVYNQVIKKYTFIASSAFMTDDACDIRIVIVIEIDMQLSSALRKIARHMRHV